VRYVEAPDGASIAAARCGSGSAVVISPAFASSIETDFETYATVFAGHEVVSWDRRGFGLSERGIRGDGAEPYLADARAVVDGLGLDRFAIVGTLMGTIEATWLAATYTDRVGRLVLRAPVTGLADWAAIPGVAAARAALDHDWEYFTESFGQFVVGWGDPAGTALAARLRAITTPDELRAMFDAFVGLDLTPEYGRITAATLVEHHSSYFFPDGYSRRIASLIASCDLTMYRGPGSEFMTDFSAAAKFLAGDGIEVGGSAGARTIMFTDIESSTALTQQLGDDAVQRYVREHEATVRRALDAHGGRQIKHTGDGIMAAFGSAASAVSAAVAIRDDSADGPVGIRIGLNTGEPIEEDGDLFGAAVQLAARITDHAAPGQVLVSNVVRELCAGKRFRFESVGDATLEGFERGVPLYEVERDSPSRPRRYSAGDTIDRRPAEA
jgi:class 3 adenylate cyclase